MKIRLTVQTWENVKAYCEFQAEIWEAMPKITRALEIHRKLKHKLNGKPFRVIEAQII